MPKDEAEGLREGKSLTRSPNHDMRLGLMSAWISRVSFPKYEVKSAPYFFSHKVPDYFSKRPPPRQF